MRIALAIALASFTLFASEIIVAQAPQPAAQEVPHPALPAGAGKIDADAATSFASTASGLKYRVLRKGTGANPRATDTTSRFTTTAGSTAGRSSIVPTSGASRSTSASTR